MPGNIMAVGSVAGGEGSSGQVDHRGTKLAEDQPDPTKYHSTKKQTIIPHRKNDDGLMPGLDPDAGLSQFTVVDDEDSAYEVKHEPGDLTPLGESSAKEEQPCQKKQDQTAETLAPSTSSELKTSLTTDHSSNPVNLTKTSKKPSSTTGRKAPTQKELLHELFERVNALSQHVMNPTASGSVEKLSNLVTPMMEELSYLKTQLDSLTNAMAPSPTSKTPSETLPHQTLGEPWVVELKGDFGHFKTEAAVIDVRSQSDIVMLFDVEKPHLVPAKSAEPLELSCSRGEYDFDVLAIPNGWSSHLLIADRDYLLIVMKVAE